jgi:hypothetical protein
MLLSLKIQLGSLERQVVGLNIITNLDNQEEKAVDAS